MSNCPQHGHEISNGAFDAPCPECESSMEGHEVSPERAAELTARCSEVWRHGDHKWSATMWCSGIGELVIGDGETALAAVLAAREKWVSESRKAGSIE